MFDSETVKFLFDPWHSIRKPQPTLLCDRDDIKRSTLAVN